MNEPSREPIYVSEVTVEKAEGLTRRATLPAGGSCEFGVHGAIKDLFRLDAPDRPLPVDYTVAAAGG
jgi:hypothetical protein